MEKWEQNFCPTQYLSRNVSDVSLMIRLGLWVLERNNRGKCYSHHIMSNIHTTSVLDFFSIFFLHLLKFLPYILLLSWVILIDFLFFNLFLVGK